MRLLVFTRNLPSTINWPKKGHHYLFYFLVLLGHCPITVFIVVIVITVRNDFNDFTVNWNFCRYLGQALGLEFPNVVIFFLNLITMLSLSPIKTVIGQCPYGEMLYFH